MSGRPEQEQKNELWIDTKLNTAPKIYKNYMISMKRKTSMTRRAYLGYLLEYNNFMTSLGIELNDVKPMNIDEYIDYLLEKGNHAQVINAKLSAIISFYNFLVDNDIITKNPCSSKKKLTIEPKSSVAYMTDEEIAEVKSSIIEHTEKYANRNLCIITLGCATGLRISAILNIDIDDIDFENKIITVIEKGNKKREVYIGTNTLESIERWIKDRKVILGEDSEEKALFISQKTHKRMTRYAVANLLNRNTTMINKRITPHKMRSTCAMKLYDKTGDIYLTAQQLGHANIKNTMIYAKATDEKRRYAAEILD